MTTPAPSIAQASQQLESGVAMFAQGARTPEVMKEFKEALVGLQRLLPQYPSPDRRIFLPATDQQQVPGHNQENLRLVQVPHLFDEGFYIHNHALLWSENILPSWQERDSVALSCVLGSFNLALLMTQDGRATENERNLRKALRLYDAAIGLISLAGPTGLNKDLDFVLLASLNNKAWILNHLGQEEDARELHRQLVMLSIQAREHQHGQGHWSSENHDIILNFVGNFSVVVDSYSHIAPSA